MSWYEIKLEMDDNDTFMAICEDFPELATFGDSVEDVLKHSKDALEEAIAYRIAEGLDIPAPHVSSEGLQYSTQIPMLTFFKAAIYMVSKAKGMTRADLSRKLGWHRNQVDRLFKLEHNSTLDQIEQAFKVLGIDYSAPIPEFSAAA